VIHVVNGLLAAGLLAASVLAWFGLPDVIPVHFDLAGNPDRWARTSLVSWFALPVLAMGLTAFLYLVAAWLPGHPRWLNFPGKERYLELPRRERAPVDRVIRSILHGSGTLVLVLFGVIQLLVYRQATGLDPGWLPALILILALGSGPAIAGVALVRLQRALDVAWRRHRAAGGG
jgi:hypothetical protein